MVLAGRPWRGSSGQRRGVEVPESVTAAVYSQTDGNPFFVTEVLRLLGAEHRLEQSDELLATGWAVPQSVREAIRRRSGRS